MGSRVCTNDLCRASSSQEWKKGWPLRSGEFANLCDKCGSAYEQLVFCDTFHSKDTGWRECSTCGKHLHCGCIASSSLLELLDSGGVKCIECTRTSGLQPTSNDENPKGLSMSTTNNNSEKQLTSVDNKVDGDNVTAMNHEQLDNSDVRNGLKDLLPSHNDDAHGGQIKGEEVLPPRGEVGNMSSSNFNQVSIGSSEAAKVDIYKANTGIKDLYESLAQTNLTIALASPSGNSNHAVVEDRELGKTISSFQQVSRSRQLLPKPPKAILATGLETNASMVPQIRVARPPAEGRLKNQLLPRYWPRITDQELQLISGDSNSTIVPLFEKVLSASDAGRIGRLVLPKACAEAYFPHISQPEGLPLRIQDVKGKEWVFQFRFWPNNNSRMYVLEGVTPCIQSMQLQAGDTVTFSRIDPEGKLLMGFRKALNTIAMQKLPVISGYSGLLQSLADSHLNALSKPLNSAGGDFSWHIMEKHASDTKDGLLLPSMLAPERKRSRNIGSKSKRLLIDSQDALELKLTWEEAQDMLLPPLSEKPSILTIEDQEFEEYEEPPVFAKRSIFATRSSGGQEQWTQCDSCSKWRKLPADILLPPKWTCPDNIWDHSRCSCSAPDELSPRELEYLLKLNKEFKKRRMITSHRMLRDQINNLSHKTPEIGKGGLDLNSDPEREEQLHQGSTRVSMMSLLQVASLPLETYLKQNGLTSLISEQEGSSGSQSLPPATTGESEGPVHEDHCVVPWFKSTRAGMMSLIIAEMILPEILLPLFVYFRF
ncbi:HSI2-like 1 [Actinidia rufa]|uniref:HSI2-like 1 n=1 Tax=Actinidia rufa TaxID=165716 RepID=A0A7J0E596_9ERIC|nr:HSI2-like 1 [Actinidia rufa]